MFFLDRQTVVGIDIGTTAIKLVELKRKENKFELINYGILEKHSHLERINEAIQTSTFKLLEERTALLIKNLFSQTKCRTRNIVMSLPNFSTFLSVIDFPRIPAREMAKVISLQASQYVPINIKDVSLDWQIIEENSEKSQVLLMAVPKEVVERYVRIAQLVNLDLRALEIESISTSRALRKEDMGIFIIVDLGGRTTSLSIVDKGFLRASRNIDTSGGDLTQVIATGLGINPLRAEELKRTFGLKKEEISFKNLMRPLLDAISLEIQKSIDNYYQKTSQRVEKIILTGGGANMLGITDYYAESFNIPVEKGDPFSYGIIEYRSELSPVLKEIGSSLTVACGLALRELI